MQWKPSNECGDKKHGLSLKAFRGRPPDLARERKRGKQTWSGERTSELAIEYGEREREKPDLERENFEKVHQIWRERKRGKKGWKHVKERELWEIIVYGWNYCYVCKMLMYRNLIGGCKPPRPDRSQTLFPSDTLYILYWDGATKKKKKALIFLLKISS